MSNGISRGRFAPSPSGPLHFGSLLAALGSFLSVRNKGGEWLLRIEDIDPPREQAGAADQILRTLESLGLEWDGPVYWQSHNSELYEAALATLAQRQQSYLCTCSRKDIQMIAEPGIDGARYPGICRSTDKQAGVDASVRVLTDSSEVVFDDLLQGKFSQCIEKECGDFILKRRDGLYAYQLAVVVDDAEQGITEIVRGCDLLDSTPRQIYLQNLLGMATPGYLHLPVAVNSAGEKLSKQTGAPAIDTTNPVQLLIEAMNFLGLTTPTELTDGDIADVLEWGVRNWSIDRLNAVRSIVYP